VSDPWISEIAIRSPKSIVGCLSPVSPRFKALPTAPTHRPPSWAGGTGVPSFLGKSERRRILLGASWICVFFWNQEVHLAGKGCFQGSSRSYARWRLQEAALARPEARMLPRAAPRPGPGACHPRSSLRCPLPSHHRACRGEGPKSGAHPTSMTAKPRDAGEAVESSEPRS